MTTAAGVSVVIPTHDTRALTLACLRSLAASDPLRAREIIVVDDGSTDGTANAIRDAYPDVRIIGHPSPRGFSAAANAGLADARGAVFWLLNSDTEVAPDAVRRIDEAFARDPTLGIASAQLWNPDGSPQWSGGPTPGVAWLFLQSSGGGAILGHLPGFRRARPLASTADRSVGWVAGAAMAIRREAWIAVGPFDESFQVYAQDLDLSVRARASGWAVRVLADCRVLHHRGQTIAALPGAAATEHHGAMWTDLVRWAERDGGPAGGRRARRAIMAGARLRLLVRRLAVPLVPASHRALWRAESAAIRFGLSQLAARPSA